MAELPFTLDDLVAAVEAQVPGDDPLRRLSAAARLQQDLDALGDQLVARFVEAARRSGSSWSQIGEQLGVTKQAAQQRFWARLGRDAAIRSWRRARGPRSGGEDPMERFSEPARQVVVAAQQEAGRLQHDYLGTEHLLLALAGAGPGSVVAEVLESVGVSADDVGRRVEEIVGRGPAPVGGPIPFTPRSKRVLELSWRQARRAGEPVVAPHHLLLGLLDEGEGLAAKLLVDLGADLPRVRDGVAEVVGRRRRETG